MGGRRWLGYEEAPFWGKIAILAPPGHDSTSQKAKSHSDIEKSWEPLAKMMRQEMESLLRPGEVLRRDYTAISCYEHYFQNYVKKKLSPNAKPYVDAYREQLKRDEERNERAATESSAAPTLTGHNPPSLPSGFLQSGGPKHAVANNNKRKFATQGPSYQGQNVTANEIDRLNRSIQQSINEQSAAMGMQASAIIQSHGTHGYNGPRALNEVQETAIPANSNNVWPTAETPIQEYGLGSGFTSMPAPGGQPSTAPLPIPEAPFYFGSVDGFDQSQPATAPNWPHFGPIGGLSQLYATAAPLNWHNQGYFNYQSAALPTPFGQADVNFNSPEMQGYYDVKTVSPQELSLSGNYQLQGQTNQFDFTQNGGMAYGYHHYYQPQQQQNHWLLFDQQQRGDAGELAALAAYTYGNGSSEEHGHGDEKNGAIMCSNEQQQEEDEEDEDEEDEDEEEEQEGAEELATLAACTDVNGSGDEIDKDDGQHGQSESEDGRPSKFRRLHD